MKLVVSVYELKQLNKWISYIDGAILHIRGFSLIAGDMDIDQAIDVCLKNHISPILAIDKMLYPQDCEQIKECMKRYAGKKVFFYTTDVATICMAEETGNLNKLIFDPQTMIANELDYKEYAEYGMHSLAMSLEIPVQDVIASTKGIDMALFYQVFGYRLMFYSRRKLLSLYSIENGLESPNGKSFLKEETREAYYPVIENENGTMIYRGYIVSLLEWLDKINRLEYAYMESLYIEDSVFFECLKLYSEYMHKGLSKETAISRIMALNLPIEDGFGKEDSIYQKELF